MYGKSSIFKRKKSLSKNSCNFENHYAVSDICCYSFNCSDQSFFSAFKKLKKFKYNRFDSENKKNFYPIMRDKINCLQETFCSPILRLECKMFFFVNSFYIFYSL